MKTITIAAMDNVGMVISTLNQRRQKVTEQETNSTYSVPGHCVNCYYKEFMIFSKGVLTFAQVCSRCERKTLCKEVPRGELP